MWQAPEQKRWVTISLFAAALGAFSVATSLEAQTAQTEGGRLEARQAAAERAEATRKQAERATSVIGYIGVSPREIDNNLALSLGIEDRNGVFINNVISGGPADAAGLQNGDVILSINGTTITPNNTLIGIVSQIKAGTIAPVYLMRGGRKILLNVVIGNRPAAEDASSNTQAGDGESEAQQAERIGKIERALGLSCLKLTPAIAKQIRVPDDTFGFVVSSVDPGSDAAAQGIRRGDVILSVNYQRSNEFVDFEKILIEVRALGRSAVLLRVQRGGVNVPVYVPVRLR